MLDKSLINTYFGQFCAGGVLVSIPISVLFVIMQKFYVEGITGGAVKVKLSFGSLTWENPSNGFSG